MSFNECTVLLRAVISRSSESFHLRNVGLTWHVTAQILQKQLFSQVRFGKFRMSTLDDGSLKPNQRQDYRDE